MPHDLNDLDQLLRSAHDTARQELAVVEGQLAGLLARQHDLSSRVRRTAIALGLDPEDLPAPAGRGIAPAGDAQAAEEPATASESPEELSQRNLWDDVVEYLSQRKRSVRPAQIMAYLAKMHGYSSDAVTVTRLHKGIARWTKAGRLAKTGPALYMLTGAQQPAGDAEEVAPPEPETDTTDAQATTTPERQPPVGRAKARPKPAKEAPGAPRKGGRATAAMAPSTVRPTKFRREALWDALAAQTKDGATTTIGAALQDLQRRGWERARIRKQVHTRLSAWTKEEKVVRVRQGVYGRGPRWDEGM